MSTPVTPPVPEAESRPLRAAAWMTGALICFSSMAVAGREASGELDTFEIMTWRSIIGLFIVCTLLGVRGELRGLRVQRVKLHVVRNLFHFTGQNLWFFAVTMIPLAQLFAFEFTNPLWVAILAPLVLGEKMTRTRVLAAALGFIGILIVARPGEASFGVGEAAAAVCAIAFAFTTMTTKMLSGTESTGSIMFMMTLTQAVFGLVCAGIDLDIAFPSMAYAPYVIVIALAGLTAHFCIANALSCAPATVVAPMEFLRLPLIAAIGAMLYDEPLLWTVFAGGAVVMAANLINIHGQRKAAAAR
ncbi:DMT family transporter [Rhodovulum sp. DZ06]|uniref:DMT family transporter n=1 Tax=Rhodovulum sp. DZ06 TaxID=3425126 RepID=UPI003D33D553